MSVDNLKTLQLFFRSMRQAKKILRDFQPDVVIGTGGYVSGAVVFQASRMHIPTLFMNKTAYLGLRINFYRAMWIKLGLLLAMRDSIFH